MTISLDEVEVTVVPKLILSTSISYELPAVTAVTAVTSKFIFFDQPAGAVVSVELLNLM